MAQHPSASLYGSHAPATPAVLLEIAQAVSSTLDLKELLKIIAQRFSLPTAHTHETTTLADAQHRR